MGLIEIIFSFIAFIIIWFIAFKVLIAFKDYRLKKDIPKKLEKQDKKYFTDGKEVDLKKALNLVKEKKEKEELEKEKATEKEKKLVEKQIKDKTKKKLEEKRAKLKKELKEAEEEGESE